MTGTTVQLRTEKEEVSKKLTDTMSPFIAALLCCIAFASAYNPPVAKTVGQPWPMPQSFQQTAQAFTVDAAGFKFTIGGQDCDAIRDATDRYYQIIFQVRNHQQRQTICVCRRNLVCFHVRGEAFFCFTCSDITNTRVGISGETDAVARISMFIE